MKVFISLLLLCSLVFIDLVVSAPQISENIQIISFDEDVNYGELELFNDFIELEGEVGDDFTTDEFDTEDNTTDMTDIFTGTTENLDGTSETSISEEVSTMTSESETFTSESDTSGSTETEISGTTEPENSDTTQPENSDTTVPENSDTTQPENSDTTEPENSDTTEPENSDTTQPENSDTTEPENLDTTEPENSGTTQTENSDTTEPENSDTTEPENSDTTEPENLDTTEPENSGTTQTENSDTTEPENSDTTESENSDTTEPENSGTTQTENSDTTEPENSDTTEPENSDTTEPENSGTTQTENSDTTEPESSGSTDISGSTDGSTDETTESVSATTPSNTTPPTSTPPTTTPPTTTTTTPPPPNVGNYEIADPKNPAIKCLKARFGAQITVTYKNTANEDKMVTINVPADNNTAPEGDCGAESSNLMLEWTPGSSQIIVARFQEPRDLTTNNIALVFKMSDDNSTYTMSSISYSLAPVPANFPGIPPSSGPIENKSKKSYFETPKGQSFRCSRSEVKEDDSGLQVTFTELQLQSFNNKEGENFQKATICPADIKPPYRNDEYIGIAVGSSLGALVLCALAVALISRYRKRRKAESLDLEPIHLYSRME